MDCSMPGFHVLRYLLECAQIQTVAGGIQIQVFLVFFTILQEIQVREIKPWNQQLRESAKLDDRGYVTWLKEMGWH